MPFLLLFYLILTTLPPWPRPPFGLGVWASTGIMAVLIALPTLGALRLAHRTRRQLVADPLGREEVLHRYGRGKVYQLYGLMAADVLALALGWGWAAPRICGIPPVEELLLIMPFIVGLTLAWACFYTADLAIHQTSAPWGDAPFGSRWGYIAFHGRQYLAIAGLPLALILGQQALVKSVPGILDSGWFWAVLLGGMTLAVTLAPWALKLILGLRPLPPGPLRDRLEAAGRRLGVRYTDILLWDTRHGMANAMVAGVVPWVRYVLLSDRLLTDLSPDEVEAVFGHEAGHLKHRHMVFYLVFLTMSLTALTGLWIIASEAIWGQPQSAQVVLAPAAPVLEPDAEPTWRDWEPVPAVLLTGVYFFLAFGFVSRRCERQADLYGCRAVSCGRLDCPGHGPGTELLPAGRGLCATGIHTFISALEKVALINGISRDRPGLLHTWLHGSIAQRVEFLEGVLTDRAVAADFQRRIGVLKWALVAALAAALVGIELAGYGGRVWAGM